MSTWQTQAAKQNFSEVMRRAHKEGPQKITCRGAESAYLLSAEDYHKLNKKTRKGSLIGFFQNSPMKNARLNIERRTDKPRDIKL